MEKNIKMTILFLFLFRPTWIFFRNYARKPSNIKSVALPSEHWNMSNISKMYCHSCLISSSYSTWHWYIIYNILFHSYEAFSDNRAQYYSSHKIVIKSTLFLFQAPSTQFYICVLLYKSYYINFIYVSYYINHSCLWLTYLYSNWF